MLPNSQLEELCSHQELCSHLKSPSLTQTIQNLDNNLKSIQPNNSQAVQIITYTLLATAVVGIAVYHYIKGQEELPSSQGVLINSKKTQNN
jgi:hypothetical protein